MNELWKGSVKAKTEGKRGYDYYHQQKATGYIAAAGWARATVDRIESAGSRVIQVYLTPED